MTFTASLLMLDLSALPFHSAELNADFKPVLADDRALTTLHGNEVLEGVTLDPFGTSTVKLTGSEPAAPAANGRP